MPHFAPRRRARLVAALGAATLVAAVAAVTLVAASRDDSATGARRAATAYLAAWSHADAGAMAALLDAPPPDLAARLGWLPRTATGPGSHFTLNRVGGPAAHRQASYRAHEEVGGFGPLEWDGTLPLLRRGRAWVVHWQPDDLYPGLAEGQRLTLQRTWAPRAAILGPDGTPLVTAADADAIGIEPDRVTDLPTVQQALHAALGVDPAAVARALAAPGVKPTFFVAIKTVRASDFPPLRARLAPVPGIVFQRSTARLGPVDGFAQPLLGSVGPVTAERLAQLGPPYRAGDTVGLSGLEAQYEQHLAGSPAQVVAVTGPGANVVRTLAHRDGTDPQPVQLTLDPAVQQAADAAIAGVAQPTVLVAVDTASGAVRAAASNAAAQSFDRALDGRYPPGSTFKIVTAAAILASGSTPDTTAPCPSQLTVGGLAFRNFEGEAPGPIPLHRAFAISCNTAFVGLASHLPAAALDTAATTFGFGIPLAVGPPSVGGAYPAPSDAAERAASSIGQGRVTASPLAMASVAATVASGQWRAPSLVVAPAPSPSPGPTPPPLDPHVAASLRAMMAEVVSDGTGTAAGSGVAGKTGTAEFGHADPPQTHAWFVGYRGTLAFAVLVEGGGVGGRVAAPLAGRFVSALPAR